MRDMLLFAISRVLLSPSFGLAAGFSGSVTAIVDGDTMEVLHNTHPERIRLCGID